MDRIESRQPKAFETILGMEAENVQGVPRVFGRFLKNGCGIQMSQATSTKITVLFKHTYS